MRTGLAMCAPLWRTLFSAVTALAFLWLAALLAGCGGSGDDATPTPSSEARAAPSATAAGAGFWRP